MRPKVEIRGNGCPRLPTLKLTIYFCGSSKGNDRYQRDHSIHLRQQVNKAHMCGTCQTRKQQRKHPSKTCRREDVKKFITYHASSKKEVVFIHVQFSCSFKYFWAHLEREKQLMTLKQTTAGEPGQNITGNRISDVRNCNSNLETRVHRPVGRPNVLAIRRKL